MLCGHLFVEKYDPKGPMIEYACPECHSNSIRRIKEKKKAAAK
jgi:hypothetical protein